MKRLRILIAALCLLVGFASPAGADHRVPLDDVGVAWLGACESDNRPHLEGYFDGEHQWLLTTWNMAVKEQGWNHLINLTPNHVEQATQREVAKGWWVSHQHGGPETQWPNCYDDAMRAMGYYAPCIGRNVIGCATTWTHPDLHVPIPNFTG